MRTHTPASMHVGEHLPVAWLLIDLDGFVLDANGLAGRLLARCGPFFVADGYFTARSAQGAALVAAWQKHERLESMCDDLHFVVTHLGADGSDSFGHLRHAMMVRVTGAPVEVLACEIAAQHRFGATPSEAAVAALIACGHSVNSIAAALGRKPSTVRTHLKRIFAKAGAKSQRQLAVIINDCVLGTTSGRRPARAQDLRLRAPSLTP